MRGPDGRFLSAAAAAAATAAAAAPAPPPPPPQPVRQALPPGMIEARMKKARARLTWYTIATDPSHVWCYRCVQRLGDDRSVVCVPPSGPRRQKCGRCSAGKHACAPDPAPLGLQMRLRRYAAISVAVPSPLHEGIFQRALREWRDK